MPDHSRDLPWLMGDAVVLRPLQPAGVGEAYVSWMNDPQVTKYLETRESLTAEDLRSYVATIAADPLSHLYAIHEKDSNDHVGNIKLGPINERHSRASIGVVVGDRDSWGRGYATEAIRLLTDFALGELGLHKVTAGVYAPNVASIKAFERVGFTIEAVQREHYRLEGRFVDGVVLGLIAAGD